MVRDDLFSIRRLLKSPKALIWVSQYFVLIFQIPELFGKAEMLGTLPVVPSPRIERVTKVSGLFGHWGLNPISSLGISHCW